MLKYIFYEKEPIAAERLLNNNAATASNDTQAVRTTFRVYGTIFVALFMIFCIVRKRYPRVYNVRNSVEKLKCDLAQDQFGYVNWVWKLFVISDDEIFKQCGMDAIAFIRMIRFGLKVSFVGIINSIYLLPVDATATEEGETDTLQELNLGNVPPGSPRIFATVFAAYLVFGYTFHLILKEFEWFTRYRHRFLAEERPDNYTVYVGGIPHEYRSSSGLRGYFCKCYMYDAVLEAHIALDIPNLEKKVAEREALVTKLEHAINVRDVQGKIPTHRTKVCGGRRVNSIEKYTEELRKMNREIENDIMKIEERRVITSSYDDGERQEKSEETSLLDQQEEPIHVKSTSLRALSADRSVNDSVVLDFNENDHAIHESIIAAIIRPIPDDDTARKSGQVVSNAEYGASLTHDITNEEEKEPKKVGKNEKGHSKISGVDSLAENVESVTGRVVDALKAGGNALASRAAASGNAIVSRAATILGGEEGSPRDAGFVTFTNLKATQSAIQMVHHPTPFQMFVLEAPPPEDIYWDNVGLTNKKRQLGTLLSAALTVLLCFFWTVPVAFVSSLTSVNELKKLLPFLEKWVQAALWLEQVLAQIAPLLLLGLIALLPVILQAFSTLEGHIANSRLQASLFSKLASFMIIQTFFVSAVSGSITSELKNMIENPRSIIDLLAKSLPAQSAYFIQILMAQTFIGLSLELLRVVPLALALLRKKFGLNLTQKERNTSLLFLRPLSDPPEFDHSQTLAQLVLYYMVLFVYSSIAPITSYVLAFNFFLLALGYRNQLIYVYPRGNDSGGILWARFINVILAAMLIAQLTLVGMLSLKKAPIATPMFVPLIICTVLFILYIKQKHFNVMKYLPTRECIGVDMQRRAAGGGMDYGFVKGEYIQPALQKKVLLPENFDVGIDTSNENTTQHKSQSEIDAGDLMEGKIDECGET